MTDTNAIRDLFPSLIRERYLPPKDIAHSSPKAANESVKMFCDLQSFYPSNHIDHAGMLIGDILSDDACSESSATSGDLYLFSDENEAAKLAIKITLHLRSCFGCIQNMCQRTSKCGLLPISNSSWYGEGGPLSLFTTEEADSLLLSIGEFQFARLPELGSVIDLRGRQSFSCSFPRKSKFGRNVEWDIVIDVNGTKVVATEKSDLVLVIDPSELYVCRAMREDSNRCTILGVIPLRSVIASATEAAIIHIVCNADQNNTKKLPEGILKNSTLSLRFKMGKHCVSSSHLCCLTVIPNAEPLPQSEHFFKGQGMFRQVSGSIRKENCYGYARPA